MDKYSTPRHKANLNEQAFDTLTPEAAYWAGMLFADGSIARGKRGAATVNLASVDVEHVEKFKRFTGSLRKIRIDTHRSSALMPMGGRPIARFTINSLPLVARLESLGMVNSLRGERIAVPELANSADFWRGVIDGDGSITVSSRGSVILQLIGNRLLMEQWVSFIRLHCPEHRTGLVKMKSIFYVRAAGLEAHALLNVLYNNDGVALDRKKAKALSVLSSPAPKYHKPSAKIKISDHDMADIVRRYQEGESAVKLGVAYGIPHHAIYQRLAALGVERRTLSAARRLAVENKRSTA
jgi:hypothetical protein